MQVFSVHEEPNNQAANTTNQQHNGTRRKTLTRDQFDHLHNADSVEKDPNPSWKNKNNNRVLDDGRVEPVLLAAADTADQLLTEITTQPKGLTRACKTLGKIALQILTIILCCVFFATLALQWQFFDSDKLPSWPLVEQGYTKLCEYIHCNSITKASDYQVEKLQVHNLQDGKNNLLITIEITNASNKAKPYPSLLLRFSTIDGSKQASRIFQSNDYTTEVRGSENHLLPAQARLNIQLSIIDPGVEYTNYVIEPLPPV